LESFPFFMKLKGAVLKHRRIQKGTTHMTIIELAREMGKEIQKTEAYKNLYAAQDANDKDEVLQDQIGQFNMKRIELNTAMSAETKDNEKINACNEELKAIYAEIMQNPNMIAFNTAKNELDSMMNQITTILMKSVNGEDPETCEAVEHSCGGSCSSCSGCH
jgi:cell fate (sporulation/competence/biofilm development) regulator YlbF (YheA/YmcA/DUF963 family)